MTSTTYLSGVRIIIWEATFRCPKKDPCKRVDDNVDDVDVDVISGVGEVGEVAFTGARSSAEEEG